MDGARRNKENSEISGIIPFSLQFSTFSQKSNPGGPFGVIIILLLHCIVLQDKPQEEVDDSSNKLLGYIYLITTTFSDT